MEVEEGADLAAEGTRFVLVQGQLQAAGQGELRGRALCAEVLGAQVPPRRVVQPQDAPQGQRRRPQQPRAPLAGRSSGTRASCRSCEAGPALRGECRLEATAQPPGQSVRDRPQRPRNLGSEVFNLSI